MRCAMCSQEKSHHLCQTEYIPYQKHEDVIDLLTSAAKYVCHDCMVGLVERAEEESKSAGEEVSEEAKEAEEHTTEDVPVAEEEEEDETMTEKDEESPHKGNAKPLEGLPVINAPPRVEPDPESDSDIPLGLRRVQATTMPVVQATAVPPPTSEVCFTVCVLIACCY